MHTTTPCRMSSAATADRGVVVVVVAAAADAVAATPDGRDTAPPPPPLAAAPARARAAAFTVPRPKRFTAAPGKPRNVRRSLLGNPLHAITASVQAGFRKCLAAWQPRVATTAKAQVAAATAAAAAPPATRKDMSASGKGSPSLKRKSTSASPSTPLDAAAPPKPKKRAKLPNPWAVDAETAPLPNPALQRVKAGQAWRLEFGRKYWTGWSFEAHTFAGYVHHQTVTPEHIVVVNCKDDTSITVDRVYGYVVQSDDPELLAQDASDDHRPWKVRNAQPACAGCHSAWGFQLGQSAHTGCHGCLG